MKIIAVIGAGTMGAHISYLCAKHGYSTRIMDTSPESIARAQTRHREWVARDFAQAQPQDAVLRRVTVEASVEKAVYGADLVIEALPENLDLKRRVFAQLDALCLPQVILASNSSSLRMSRIEQEVRHRERTANLHFFLPPLRPVEIMGGSATSAQTIASLQEFGASLHLRPFVLRKESTGLLYNRIWRALKREVLHEVADGVATPEEIDRIIAMAWGWDRGPFAWMDHVGLDVVRDIEMVYFGESRDPKDRPPQFLEDMIARGELGVKTGRGFYAYPCPAYRQAGWLAATADFSGKQGKQITRADFTGAWQLVSFETTANGQKTYPLGRDARGSLVYTQTGQMGVVLSKEDRKPFSGADIMQGTAEEKREAFESCLAYFGTFDVKEDAVVHRIEHCTFPNWVGTEQLRFYQLDGDHLSLETPPMPVAGIQVVSRLVWERIR